MINPSSTSLTYPLLRSLCLPEPFMIQNLQTQLLPALASLVHLKRFMIFVWNDRRLQPTLLGDIHAVLPGLEELSLGVDNEKLQWWQGDLVSYNYPFLSFPQHSKTDHLNESSEIGDPNFSPSNPSLDSPGTTLLTPD